MRKVAVERKGETNFFTSAHIKDCMKKVIAVTLHQTVQVIFEIVHGSLNNCSGVNICSLYLGGLGNRNQSLLCGSCVGGCHVSR